MSQDDIVELLNKLGDQKYNMRNEIVEKFQQVKKLCMEIKCIHKAHSEVSKRQVQLVLEKKSWKCVSIFLKANMTIIFVHSTQKFYVTEHDSPVSICEEREIHAYIHKHKGTWIVYDIKKGGFNRIENIPKMPFEKYLRD